MRVSIILTVIMLFLGTLLYLNYAKIPPDQNFFKTMKLKAGFTEKGEMKIFAYAKPEELSKLRIKEGKNFFKNENEIIFGYKEAEMMREEKLFLKTGDNINNFFGADIVIGAILKKTGTIADDMHFFSEKQFNKINGKNNLFLKISNEGMPKLFYTYDIGDTPNLALKEGSMDRYKIIFLGNKTYYPLIIGSDEAEMMISENLFKKSGDLIENFFRVNVHVAGIVEKTNSVVDMVHFVPLSEGDFYEN